jgi:hypothetical protein
MKECQIAEYISVAPRYLRSVNLSSDWRRPESFAGYIVTQNVAQALDQLCNGLSDKNGQRAFTLIGPYGTGKSAFAVYLCQLLAHDGKDAAKANELLKNGHSRLIKQFERARVHAKGRKGFLPIAVTARRRPIGQLILEALGQAVLDLKKTTSVKHLVNQIQIATDRDSWKDTATILKFLDEIGNEAKSQGYTGQLLLIDEAGKTLEYALQDKEGGDVYVFQEIAEYANRQQDCPLLFLITLHQMFDDYVELAERTIRAEWTKVQERFQAIQFAESAATTVQMLADAFLPNSPRPNKANDSVNYALDQLEKSSAPLPIGLNNTTFRDMARRAWPLHPTVLLAMPHLFRRLAQNERSIFSYLTSHEPFGFQEHLQKTLGADGGYVRLHDLYTYLLANFEAGLARLPHAKRLLEANDVINSRQNLSPQQYDLIRTVSILNVLGEMCPLRATLKFLECAAPQGVRVEAELAILKQQSILTYRQLDGSYRVWEGSDVDIDARMKEARRHLQMEGGSFLETLRRHLPHRSLVARRHSLETGAHRFFKVLYAENIEKPENYLKMKIAEGESGWVLVLLPHADIAVLRKSAEQATQAQTRLIIALPRQIEALRSVVEEVACLRWVADNTEELRDDRVARRELSLRLVEGEQKIAQLLQTLLDPRPAPDGNSCQWFWNGEDQVLKNHVDVTKLLSKACEHIYPKSPSLRNELIARTTISSAASSARRCLLEKMLTSAGHERLGITGFPPERSIYESVLYSSELHTFDHTKGAWGFQVPPRKNHVNLRPCWDLLEQEIFTAGVEKVEVQAIFSRLAEAPYGLPQGVHPILFTAFYLFNQDDVFLYREDSFVPDPQPAHFELLQRRPDLFSISGARLNGIRRVVVERLAKGLKAPAKTASVVRALFRFINGLPQITVKSSRFKQKMVIEMRNRFLHAKSPEDLLFSELPECFDMKPFLDKETRENDVEHFFNNLNVCLTALRGHASYMQDNARNILLKNCNLPAGKDGWKELERRAIWLGPRINNEILTPFLNSVTNGIADNHNSKPALSLVANRSFDQWTDIDVERFSGLADGIGDQVRKAWRHFGDSEPELSATEIQQKNKLRNALEPQLLKIRGQASNLALAAVLRDLLHELEHESEERQERMEKS